jgi:NitT/TauT family transport system substrate-binding protein
MERRTILKAGAAMAVPMLARRAAAQSLTTVKFVTDFAYQGNHAIWGLGIDRGLFKAQGLNVAMDRGYGSGDSIVKVASGAYDIGFADLSALVKFNASNPDKRVIAVYQGFDRTLTAIITLKKSGITKPAELVGHVIGGQENDASRLLFPAFARVNHFDADKVSWKSVAPNLREAILVQNQVDAISGFTSTSIFNLINVGIKKDDIVALPFATNGLDLYGNAVIVREAYLAKNPDLVRGFVKGTIESTKALIKDPAAGMEAMKARDPLFDTKLEAQRLQLVLDDAILTPAVRKDGFGVVDPARIALLISLNAEAYGIANPPTPEQIYTIKFLPPAAERMVAT